MSDFENESREALAGADAGPVLGDIQHPEDTTTTTTVEAAPTLRPVSQNNAVALKYAEITAVFLADPTPKEDDPSGPSKSPLVPKGVSWKAMATSDPDTLTSRFRNNPGALPALPCGHAKILVIDCDIKGGVDGVGNFQDVVAEHGGLPAGVVTIRTLSGGLHYIFAAPEGEAFGNSPGSLPPGIDVRGAGGYIIAAGARWGNGGWKEVDGSPLLLESLRNRTIPLPPEWLLSKLRGRKKDDRPPKQPREPEAHERASTPRSVAVGSRERSYAVSALVDEHNIVASAPEGNRNSALNKSSFKIGTYVGAGWLDESLATDELAKAAHACGLPGDEAAKTIASGLGAGMKSPHPPLEDKPAQTWELKIDGTNNAEADSAPAGDTTPEPGASQIKVEPPAPRKTFEFLFEGDDDMSAPPALIKKLLPLLGVMFLGGQSGAGKTFVAILLAVCLASGRAFFGRKVKERVGVAALAAEDLATIPIRLHVARKEIAPDEFLPIARAGSVPDLNSKEAIDSLIAALKDLDRRMREHFGVRLGCVIIDTIAAAFSMQDENSNAEAAAIMSHLHRLSNEVGALVVPVHHFGKDPTTGLRGASAWRGGADAVLSVSADRNQITGRVENRAIALSKSRVGVEGPLGGFDLSFIQTGVDEDGEEVGSCIVIPTDAPPQSEKARNLNKGEKTYLAALEVKMDEAEKVRPFEGDDREVKAVERDKVRKEFYAVYDVDGEEDSKKKADAKKQAFKRAQRQLVDRKRICVRDVGDREWVWPLTEELLGFNLIPKPDSDGD
jgi:hypothetical protein